MELNNIKSSKINWGDAANALNQNFGKINNAIEQVKNVTTRNKGYFSSSDKLLEAYPSAHEGDIAYVKQSGYTPFERWRWNGAAWEGTGESGGNDNVSLGDYYNQAEIDGKFTNQDEKLSELESKVFNLDREDWSLEKTYVVKQGDEEHIILSYLGKTPCTFYISGTSPQRFRIQAKNKATGNALNIIDASSTATSLPLEIANPRTDLELVDVNIFFPSTATNGDTITIKIVKGNPLTNAIEKNAEQDKELASHKAVLESHDEQLTNIFNLDKGDWSLEKTYVVKPGTEHIILPYLGKTPCTFYISGTSPQRFRIQATNKETGNRLNFIDAISTPSELPVTISNSRTDLELVDVALEFSSLATEGDITIKIVKNNPLEKVITKNAEQDKELASHKAVLESHDEQLTNIFNLDKVDWSLEKTYVVKPGTEHIILSYLGKTPCTFYISGTSPQRFRIQAKNKDTGNPINIVDAISTATSLPIEVANSRTDLELVDVNVFFPSTANDGDTITIKIVKSNPLEKVVYNLNWDAKNRGCYSFGNGIDYNPPMVEVPAIMSNFTQLQPWYDLYDALVSQYPNYVSKENCDSVFLSANPSVEKPSALADLPIYMYKFIPVYPKRDSTGRPTNKSKLKVLITTGTHPEYIAMWSCYQTMKRICESWSTDANLKALRWDVEFYIIPCSGPWGITHATRTNANGVDLNRNMPNKDWVLSGQVGDNTYSGPSAGSEYESKLLAYYIDTINPVIYIDYHNFGTNKGGSLMYGTSSDKLAVDIAINAFQEICSELSIHYSDLPNADSANFELLMSYFGQSEGKGIRSDYASEKNNMIGLVYENSYSIYWENGVLNTSGEGHIRDELVCSIAANSWVRFLCYIIKGVADNWIPL